MSRGGGVEQDPASVRQFDTAGCADQQVNSQPIFQRFQLQSHGWRAHTEGICSCTH